MRSTLRPSKAERERIIPMNLYPSDSAAMPEMATDNLVAVNGLETDDVSFDEMCLDLGVGD